MSVQISPTLYIGYLKRNNFKKSKHINKSMYNFHNYQKHLNKDNIKFNNINNLDLEPTYDIFTDFKFIKTYGTKGSNINLLNKSSDNIDNSFNQQNIDLNKNEFKLSKLSLDKYEQMKKINNSNNDNNLNNNFSKNEKQYENANNYLSDLNKNKNYYINHENNYRYKINNYINKENNFSRNNLNKNNNYYFDYRNDNYMDIKNKIKKEDNLSSFNNKLKTQYNYSNENIKNENHLKNDFLINENKSNNIILENVGKDYKITNNLNDIEKNYIIEKKVDLNIKNENGNSLLICLKNKNEEQEKIILLYKQIINSLFYFINQLSQQFSINNKSFNLSYYLKNINDLSSDLNDLNKYIITKKNIQYNLNKKKTDENPIFHKRGKENILGESFSFGKNEDLNYKNNLNKDNKEDKKIKNNILLS